MTPNQHFEKRTLQGALYSGVALIIISMLFFLRGVTDTSFLGQVVPVLVIPAIFYGIGILICRYLNAPLAAPGIVATGAWLVGVALVHLYDRAELIPPAFQSFYWLVCSLVAAGLVTVTGHRIRIWMIVPLVPLVQVNALWAVFSLLGISVLWVPALSLVLVMAWWEVPVSKDRWRSIYRVSGLVFGGLMLLFSLWIPFSTLQSLFITWGTAAACCAVLGFRHRLPRFMPVTVMLLAGTILLGLPSVLWAFMLFVLSVGTIFYVERSAARPEKSKDVLWAQLTLAAGLIWGGVAALIAELNSVLRLPSYPMDAIWLLLAVGSLLIWFGFRHEKRTAIHGGLWLLAAAWAHLYFSIALTIESYGLWLILFAACVLLVQRLFTSRYKEKQKAARSVVESVMHWPGADLALGLSVIALCWTAAHITDYTPSILTLTFSIIIGVWIVSSLIYRIPILLHLSLWIAPIPFAMLLMLVSPVFYSLPVLGLGWQFFGIILLVIGHTTPRYRPVMRFPFFITGYALLIFGFSTAINNALLLPASLTILIAVCIATAVAVIFDYHPMWHLFVERLAPFETRPYAHRYIRHTFLFLSAWLTAIWLHLMLGYTQLTWSQQGLCLVIFSCLWFLLGTVLGRFPGMVGLPLLSAGWMLWLVGLMEVFYSPTEALFTVVLGLIASVEALRRTRDLIWIPLVILQILFTALQASWLFHLPAPEILLITAFVLSVFGLLYKQKAARGGQLTALIGLILMLGIWKVYPALNVPIALCVWSIVATFVYRQAPWVWVIQGTASLILVQFRWQVNPLVLLALGLIQLVIGVELAHELRPRNYQRLIKIIVHDHDWATPLLTVGGLSSIAALVLLTTQTPGWFYLITCLCLAGWVGFYSVRLRAMHLPYVAMLLVGAGVLNLFRTMATTGQQFASTRTNLTEISHAMPLAALGLICFALLLQTVGLFIIRRNIKIGQWAKALTVLWLRPMLLTALIAAASSLTLWLVYVTQSNGTPVVNSVTGVCLALFLFSIYRRQPQHLIWLCGAVGALGLSWIVTLQFFRILTPAWVTLPIGLGLLLVGKYIQHPERRFFDCGGGLLWLVGALSSLDPINIISVASIGYFFYVLVLLGYGMLLVRRIPLFTGMVMGAIGLIACLGKVNLWLIPMGCGFVLISGTLLLETRSAAARAWIAQAQTFWQRLE